MANLGQHAAQPKQTAREVDHCADPDDDYDDEQHHTRCSDCKGSGYYTGFTERKLCPTCDGSGFL